MRLAGRIFAIAASLLLVFSVGAAAPTAGGSGPRLDYYVSLGDSLAFGFQPDLARSMHLAPADYRGYAEDYAAAHPDLTLANFGCPGETSASLLGKPPLGRCPWIFTVHQSWDGAASQAAAAYAFLQAHPGQVDLISVDIGSNDMLALFHRCRNRGSHQIRCVRSGMPATLTALQANYRELLTQLTALAPNARIVLFNYYNPLALRLPGSDRLAARASAVVDGLATEFHAKVADAFSAINHANGASSERKSLCSYTWQCSRYHDVHPRNRGYGALADALALAAG